MGAFQLLNGVAAWLQGAMVIGGTTGDPNGYKLKVHGNVSIDGEITARLRTVPPPTLLEGHFWLEYDN